MGIIETRAEGTAAPGEFLLEDCIMNKNTFKTVTLGKGEMNIYDFGEVKLHAYKTNDFLSDEVFILEKEGNAVILEPPCFFDNIQELTAYLEGMKVVGMLVAYHGAGGTFLPDVPKYATANAADYSENGGGKALIQNFAGAFGEIFDSSVHQITNVIPEGSLTLGGMRFIIHQTGEAFDVEIPQCGAVYTHMLGHDCHSIVAGAGHADAIIGQLEGYLKKDVELILTSHYTPEDLKDAQAKIAYLENLKKIAKGCPDGESFKAEVRRQYPDYSGGNYLDMTAGFFFA